jgi:TonB family protein
MFRSFTLLSVVLFTCSIGISGAQTIPSQSQLSPAVNERERGIDLFRLDRVDEAIAVLKKVVKDNKQDYEAWHFLGLALIKKRELKEASKSFEAALAVEPQFAAGHAGLAYSLLLRNKSSEAVREAQAALAIDPGIPDAHYIIGVVRLRSGKKDDALKEASAVIKLKSDFGPAYLLKSQALVSFSGDVLVAGTKESFETNRNRYRDAAAALEKYLQLVPKAEYKETWMDQLESLRAFAMVYPKGDPNAIVSAREATTKARVLAKPEPTYTDQARRNQVTGTVVLRCVFAADGIVKHMLVLVGLPDGLTENAIRAARKIKFVPATINGQPVSMIMELQYNFNLY